MTTDLLAQEEVGSRIRLPGIPLQLADRCDGPGLSRDYPDRVPYCGAQAFTRIGIAGNELLFCGHHYASYELAFLAAGYDVDDQRSRINEKPSPGNADVG